ncbi:BIG1-domain-containing protein [Xylariaceae sp. FL0255]|nr:BIG1-domain-containing protein [Xylariaceae sp. FL0255]
MRLSITATAIAGLCASAAHAFADSSPLIVFSTAKLTQPPNQSQLQSSSKVLASTKELLSSCPTDHYLLVSQPNLNAAHLSSKVAVPKLSESLDSATSSYSIAEVLGAELNLKSIGAYIRDTCGLPGYAVDEVELTAVPAGDESQKVLKENDDKLGMILDQYTAGVAEGRSFTVIYTGGSRTEKPQTYKPEFSSDTGMGHSELKRQLHGVGRRQKGNDTSNLPLFEKYQYFTPGIFSALIVLVILMAILYTGISAVASLQVSYGAFDKEMGPAAQKKQQ